MKKKSRNKGPKQNPFAICSSVDLKYHKFSSKHTSPNKRTPSFFQTLCSPFFIHFAFYNMNNPLKVCFSTRCIIGEYTVTESPQVCWTSNLGSNSTQDGFVQLMGFPLFKFNGFANHKWVPFRTFSFPFRELIPIQDIPIQDMGCY